MTVARRALGGLAVTLALAALFVLATGGLTIGRWSITRAEDLVAILAVVVAAWAFMRGGGGGAGLSRRAAGYVVAASVGTYVGLMGFVTVTRHLTFKTHALDLGYYVQVVWQLAHAHAPYVTLPSMHAWGDHLSPVLYLLVPLDRAAPGAVTLLLTQTVILAAGGLAAFGYARHRLTGPGVAAAFAGLYLVNPSLHGMNVRDVHPAAFALPLLVVAAFAFDRGRHAWCALALVLTLATREDAAVAVVGFGIWLALARGRWRLGAAVAGLSALVLAVDVTWLMPLFRGSPYPHLHRYGHLGASLPDILVTLFLRPGRWLSVVFTGPKLLYLAELLAPLGLLPLLAPRALAAALPGLAVNLLSRDPILFNYRSQYQAFVLPFLILAAIEGYRRLVPGPTAAARAARIGASRMLGAAFLFSALLSARTVNELTVTRWWIGEDTRRLHALVARVPEGAAVSVNERVVPHLAARSEAYIFPAHGPAPADYVLERAPVVAATPAGRFDPAGYREVGRAGEWVLLTRSP